MKKTFITHPYKNDPENNKKDADIICRLLYEDGLMPVSPLHLFSFIDEEKEDTRELIMESCFVLIAYDVQQVFAFGVEGGCRREIGFAKTLGIPVFYKALIKKGGEYIIVDVC